MGTSQILIALGLVAIAIELILGVATGFELFIVGIIFILGGIAFPYIGLMYSFVFMIVLCALYLFFGRAMIRRSLYITTQKTNTDLLVCHEAIVTAKIGKNTAGKVDIDGEIWRAESDTIVDIGQHVIVQSVSGVTVKVKPMNSL